MHLAHKKTPELRAEGLCSRQEDAAVGNGISLHKVEIAIGIWLVVVVQTVAAQSAQQRLVFSLRLWYICEIDTCRIALELDVETEFLLLYIGCQIVNVLHHQRPVGLLGIIRRVLQGLNEECIAGFGMVGGKFSHLICTASVSKLESHSQHLVGLQGCLQRDISQG